MPEPSTPTTWFARLAAMGHVRAVLLVTVAAVALSLKLTWVGMHLADRSGESRMLGLALAVIVPCIVAPIVAHTIMSLVRRLMEARAELVQQASRDSLTQVYNRRYFLEQVEREADRFFRTGDRPSLLLIDADEFTTIADRHGQPTADRVLQLIARACTAQLREYDVLARFGDERFAVMLPATSMSDAFDVAERIRSTVNGSGVDAGDGTFIHVTVSIGVSSLGVADHECRMLFESADAALSDARRSGCNQTVVMPLPQVGA